MASLKDAFDYQVNPAKAQAKVNQGIMNNLWLAKLMEHLAQQQRVGAVDTAFGHYDGPEWTEKEVEAEEEHSRRGMQDVGRAGLTAAAMGGGNLPGGAGAYYLAAGAHALAAQRARAEYERQEEARRNRMAIEQEIGGAERDTKMSGMEAALDTYGDAQRQIRQHGAATGQTAGSVHSDFLGRALDDWAKNRQTAVQRAGDVRVGMEEHVRQQHAAARGQARGQKIVPDDPTFRQVTGSLQAARGAMPWSHWFHILNVAPLQEIGVVGNQGHWPGESYTAGQPASGGSKSFGAPVGNYS